MCLCSWMLLAVLLILTIYNVYYHKLPLQPNTETFAHKIFKNYKALH